MYKYEDPLERGYQKIFLTKKQHNELFPKRKMRWHDKYDHYIKEDDFLMECTKNKLFIVMATLLLPLVMLLSLIQSKEIFNEYKSLFKQKSLGNFTLDNLSSETKTFQKIRQLVKT